MRDVLEPSKFFQVFSGGNGSQNDQKSRGPTSLHSMIFKVIVIFFEFDFRKVGKAAKIKIHACHKHQIYAKLYT